MAPSGPAQVASSPPRFWREHVVPGLPHQAGLVLAAGGLLTAVLAVFAQLNVGRQAALWENGHWTAAATTAFAAAMLGARNGQGCEREVRGWVGVALGMWLIGQLAWDVETLLGSWRHTGTALTAYGLLTVVPAGLALRASIRGRIRRSEETVVYLDALSIFFAIVALLTVVLGRQAAELGGVPGGLLLAYPIVFLAATGAILSGSLAIPAKLLPMGSYALLAGLALIGFAWLTWLPVALEQPVPPGYPPNLLFSLGLLVSGVGAAAWSDGPRQQAPYHRLARRLEAALSVIAVGMSTLILLFHDQLVDERLFGLVQLSVGLTVSLAIARLSVLLRDRDRMIAAVESARDQVHLALTRAEVAAADQQARAELLARVLAASEYLVLAEIDQSYGRALSMLVPEGAQGSIARFDVESQAFVSIAAQGQGSRAILGRVIPAAVMPAGVERLQEGRLIAYRATGDGPLAQGVDQGQERCVAISPESVASIILPLRDRSGSLLGLLHLEDHAGERILEPTFVDFARLVANQLAVALENSRLLDQLRDQIEEMHRVQSHLVQASKLTAIGELAAAVAHEVNNPLTGVLGYADLLLAELSAEDPHRGEVEVIRSEAMRARSIIRALLDFARPRQPQHVPTDLNDLSGSTLGLMRYHVERGGIQIVEAYGELPLVDLDPGAMKQVLVNLLNNAIQAMPDGGTLTIATLLDGDEAVVYVSDDGPGMDDTVRARVFEPFFTTRDQASGAGLGLSVSLGLVEAHGGVIAIESQLGRGTTVEVRLPIRALSAPEPILRSAAPTTLKPSIIRSGAA